jgi:hypothetical protein
VQIRRIRDGDEQALAALHQRQHAMLREQLVRDELDGFEIRLNRVEIYQRDAEFLRSGDGDLARVRQIVRDQVRHEIGVRFLGGRHRRLHGLLVQQAVLDETQRQALQSKALRVDGGYDVVSHGRKRRRELGS